MRIAVASILLVLSTAHTSFAAEPARPRWSHTRPLTAGAADLVRRGSEQSAIIRAQLEALERTDLVVYVVDSVGGGEFGPKAFLEFVASAGGKRYVVVKVDRWRLNPSEAVAWLGHELQHALEVASAPEVTDAVQLARLYHKIGWEHGSGRFETEAARMAGHRVRNELARLPR